MADQNQVYLDTSQSNVDVSQFVPVSTNKSDGVKTTSNAFITTYVYPLLIVVPLLILILTMAMSKSVPTSIKVVSIILILISIIFFVLSRYNVDIVKYIRRK